MKKLSLNVESLRTEPYFTTTPDAAERGTVAANATGPQACLTRTVDFTCSGSTCGQPTNAFTCRC